MSLISQDSLSSAAPALMNDREYCTAANLSDAHREDLSFLRHLSSDYPGVDRWYIEKVIQGELVGTRRIFRIEREDRLVALGIAKDECGEKKICTVRVHPCYIGRGMGLRVFDYLLNWLQTDRPVLTVSERKLPQFQRLFDHYGFVNTSVRPDLYRRGVSELAYNEVRSH